MGTVRKREAAKRDLIAQWVWYAQKADIETADRFLKNGIELVRVVHGNRDLERLLMEGLFR